MVSVLFCLKPHCRVNCGEPATTNHSLKHNIRIIWVNFCEKIIFLEEIILHGFAALSCERTLKSTVYRNFSWPVIVSFFTDFWFTKQKELIYYWSKRNKWNPLQQNTILWPLLRTWFNFKPSMEMQSDPLLNVKWNYLIYVRMLKFGNG